MKKFLLFTMFTLFIFTLHAQVFTGTKNSKERSRTLDKVLTAYEVFSLDAILFDQFIKSTNYDGEVTLNLGDKNWEMILFENDIRSDNYVERVITPNGIINHPIGENITFKGALKNDPSSKIRLTVKGNFIHGVIKTSAGEYFIEPAKKYSRNYSDNSYLLYDVKNVIANSDVTCGVDEVKHFKNEKTNELPESSMMTCVELELGVLSDYSYYQKHGSTVGGSSAQAIAVMNAVNTDYDTDFTNEIEFKISEHVVSTCADCDPLSTTLDLGGCLDEFSSWGKNGGFLTDPDLGQFWTDRDFTGTSIGLAWIGVVCGNNRYHVLQDYSGSIEYQLRVLVSHEIGHNFDCSHDAQGSSFIMAPSVNNTTTWSSASISSVNAHLGGAGCLTACPASPCAPITNMTVSNTNTNVTATWSASPAGSYRVILYDSNDNQISSTNTTNTSITLTPPLTLCNQYKISVESNCGSGNFSPPVLGIFRTDFQTDFEILCARPSNCSGGTYDLILTLIHGAGNGSGFNVTADGTTQNFTYSSSPQVVTVTGLTANGNASTAVSVTAASGGGGDCDANTTYREPNADCSGVVFEETFNRCQDPTDCGWTLSPNVVGADEYEFKFDWNNLAHQNYGNTNTLGNQSFDGSCFAFLDDDKTSNPSFTGIINMTTPVMDLTDYSGVTLDFDYNFHNFEDSGGSKGPNDSQFDVEVYNGTSWVNVLSDDDDDPACRWFDEWEPGDNCLTAFSLNVDVYNNADFQVRFIYTDGNNGDWTGMIAIDNVVVSATTHTGGCTTFVDYYPDTDGDGYGDGTQTPTQVCLGDPPPQGFVSNDTDCDDNNMNDVDIVLNNNPVTAGLHQANNSINSMGFVPNSPAAPGFITFKAGVTIFLNPGFVAEAGSDFTAKIEPCSSTPSPLIQSIDEELEVVSDSKKEEMSTQKSKTQLLVYPNPTRERTFVEFEVKESTQVNLLVFDARGNVVNKLLENKMMEEGYHQMSFETNELPVGIYTVFLRIGEEMISKRLIVQKD